MYYVLIDFETRSFVDLKRAGPVVYAEDPSTEIICAAFKVMGQGQVYRWEPIAHGDDFPAELRAFADDRNAIFLAHNAGFEQSIWNHIVSPRYNVRRLPPGRWDDTQAWALHKGLPGALDKAAKAMGLSEQKDKSGKRLLDKLSKPRKRLKGETEAQWRAYPFRQHTDDLKALGDYCVQDVLTEEALAQAVGPLPDDERQIWLLDQKINQRGVAIDLEAVSAARDVMKQVQRRICDEVGHLTNGRVTTVNQTERMSEWVKERVGKAPADWTAETVEKVIANGWLRQNHPEVHRLFQLRQAGSKASTAKLEAMASAACSDGRARYLLQYQGAASTGRWSGRLIQPQNLPRGTIKASGQALIDAIKTRDLDFIELMYGDPAEVVSSALRAMLIAGRGRDIAAADFAAIEARVVLALAQQTDKVALLRDGHDIYCDMATEIFGYKVEDKTTHPDERQVGKAAVLGLGFGCGAETFQAKFCPDRPLAMCDTVVQTYRYSWAPRVKDLWEEVNAAAVGACFNNERREVAGLTFEMEGKWLTMRLPSGRKLYYRDAYCDMRSMPWDKDDRRLSLFFFAFKYGQWRKVAAYGGLLVENAVQAIARDIMANAMVAADARNIPVILTVHDEVAAEPRTGSLTTTEFEKILVSCQPDWVSHMGIPLAAEAWIGKRYQK